MTTQAIAIDFRDLAPIRAELAVASAKLADADVLPESVAALVRELATSIRDMAHSDWDQSVDPYLRVEIDQVTIAALLALASDDQAERLEGIELAIEAIRDILHDIGESSAVGDDRPADELSRWLKDTTQGSSQELADLLGVSRRTFERWLAATSEPQGDDRMRLVLAARIVNQLRHAMTGRGTLLWFSRPMPDLGRRAPREFLVDTLAAPRLVGLAAQARRSDAS